jgi:hypothetical protein
MITLLKLSVSNSCLNSVCFLFQYVFYCRTVLFMNTWENTHSSDFQVRLLKTSNCAWNSDPYEAFFLKQDSEIKLQHTRSVQARKIKEFWTEVHTARVFRSDSPGKSAQWLARSIRESWGVLWLVIRLLSLRADVSSSLTKALRMPVLHSPPHLSACWSSPRHYRTSLTPRRRTVTSKY